VSGTNFVVYLEMLKTENVISENLLPLSGDAAKTPAFMNRVKPKWAPPRCVSKQRKQVQDDGYKARDESTDAQECFVSFLICFLKVFYSDTF